MCSTRDPHTSYCLETSTTRQLLEPLSTRLISFILMYGMIQVQLLSRMWTMTKCATSYWISFDYFWFDPWPIMIGSEVARRIPSCVLEILWKTKLKTTRVHLVLGLVTRFVVADEAVIPVLSVSCICSYLLWTVLRYCQRFAVVFPEKDNSDNINLFQRQIGPSL